MMAEKMAYVARRPCGCLCAAAVDDPEHRRHVDNEVVSWLRDGYPVERMTVEAVREATWTCPTCHPPKSES